LGRAVRHRARGQIIVWVAVMFPMLFLPIAGLMIDAGIMFDARRDLQNLADGAARVGAMELDTEYLRGLKPGDLNPTGYIHLDPDHAERQADAYLDQYHFPDGNPRNIHANSQQITVALYRDVPTSFLRLVHVNSFRINATGYAAPCSAVTGDECLANRPPP